MASIERALARGLDDRYGHYNVAASLMRCGRRAEAVAPMRAACTANPGNAEFRRQLVELLQDREDPAAMLAEMEQLGRRAGRRCGGGAMFARGVFAVQRADLYARAVHAAERADYLARGENAAYRALLADALEHNGDAADAASLRARMAK